VQNFNKRAPSCANFNTRAPSREKL